MTTVLACLTAEVNKIFVGILCLVKSNVTKIIFLVTLVKSN